MRTISPVWYMHRNQVTAYELFIRAWEMSFDREPPEGLLRFDTQQYYENGRIPPYVNRFLNSPAATKREVPPSQLWWALG